MTSSLLTEELFELKCATALLASVGDKMKPEVWDSVRTEGASRLHL